MTTIEPDAPVSYDVVILGSHLATGLLATVLAKQDLRVLLVGSPDDTVLPSGDSTVPYTTAVLHLLAERFDVPEIASFAHFEDLPDAVRRTSGIKKSLAFLHHTAGRRHDPAHAVQFHVPGEHSEWHLYRPVVDGYARELAVRYGASVLPERASTTEVRLDPEAVHLTFGSGRTVTARFVVDACDQESPLRAATAEGDPRPLLLRSKMMHAYLRGVRPFEECSRLADYQRATTWSRGTVHHLFDGGWIQVVDFRNHDDAASDLCSVTVGLDHDRFDDLPADPDAAFRALVAPFPSLAEQFASATAEGGWTTSPHWQRRAAVTHGPRWFAMELSACRTDEFLSRDVTMTAEMVHALGAALPRALRDEPATGVVLAEAAAFQDALIEFNDQILAAARTAVGSFALWNAYSRVWLLWQILGHLSLKRATNDALAAGTWDPVERFADGGLWFRTPDGLRQMLDWFFEVFARVRAGGLRQAEAADMIFRELRRARFVPPLYRFGDPNARYYHFTMPRRLLMVAWVMTVAPADFKRLLTKDNVTGRRDDATSPTRGRASVDDERLAAHDVERADGSAADAPGVTQPGRR
ncbi:NAD(P)/FAD-dependent oxidoreductase [Micromonospora sp. DT44]|uniref:NAD(P)/FAD-dependent oxidoreductase n=1 Tax=Micromonospora sp. DT44 TaxID=3393439 RepID=UPI003CF1F8DA